MTCAPRPAIKDRECPGSRANLQDDIIGSDVCLLDDQLMEIQVDKEVLSQAMPGAMPRWAKRPRKYDWV